MKYPEVLPAMRLVKDAETRRRIVHAKESMCQEKNVPLLEDLIIKRAEIAHILGYDSFSKYALEDKMAKLPETVEKFEEQLSEKLLVKGREELDELVQLKREETGDTNAELKPWDKSFYANIQKERFYQVDEEAIAKFFPTDHVVEETMTIYQELFGLRFQRIEA